MDNDDWVLGDEFLSDDLLQELQNGILNKKYIKVLQYVEDFEKVSDWEYLPNFLFRMQILCKSLIDANDEEAYECLKRILIAEDFLAIYETLENGQECVLSYALRKMSDDRVSCILEEMPEQICTFFVYEMPTKVAADFGNFKSLKLLFEKNFVREENGAGSQTLLQYAVQKQDIKLADFLLKELHHNPNMIWKTKKTPLEYAKENEDIEMINLLKSNGGKLIKKYPAYYKHAILTTTGFYPDYGQRLTEFIKTENKTILIIPLAAEDPEMLEREETESLKKFGFEKQNIYVYNDDGRVFPEGIDYIDVPMGSRYKLLKSLNEDKNLILYIRKLVQNGAVYIGASAGAEITSGDLKYMQELEEENYKLSSYRGLGFFDDVVISFAEDYDAETIEKCKGNNNEREVIAVGKDDVVEVYFTFSEDDKKHIETYTRHPWDCK